MRYLLFIFIAFFAFSYTISAQEQNERNKGIELYRQGEYEKAVEAFQKHVKTEEKDRLAWLYMGASFVKLEKKKEATEAFKKTDGVSDKDILVYDKKLKITRKKAVPYTQTARENRITGTVLMAVEFGADGKIGFVFPVKKLPYGLTESVIDAAKDIEFEPAVKDGKPVTVVSTISYSFTMY